MKILINKHFRKVGSKPWQGGTCQIYERKKNAAKLFVAQYGNTVDVGLYLYDVNVLKTEAFQTRLFQEGTPALLRVTAGVRVVTDARFRERPIKGRQEGMNKFMKRKDSNSHIFIGHYISTVYVSGHFCGVKSLVVKRTANSIVRVRYN
jgi:hypothetical protein